MFPKALRDELGLRPGEVEVTADGNGLRIEVESGEMLEREGDLLVIPRTGVEIDDDLVRALRDAHRR